MTKQELAKSDYITLALLLDTWINYDMGLPIYGAPKTNFQDVIDEVKERLWILDDLKNS